MKRPLNRGVVPSGGTCRYIDPDKGFIVKHPMWDWCKAHAKEERIKRGLPIPFNWDALFEEGFCKGTPQGCFDVPDAPVETGPSWTKLAVQFGIALLGWARSGFSVTSWDEFKTRYTQCTGDENTPRCPRFSRFSGTGIAKCGACGCSSLKLFMKNERCPLGKW